MFTIAYFYRLSAIAIIVSYMIPTVVFGQSTDDLYDRLDDGFPTISLPSAEDKTPPTGLFSARMLVDNEELRLEGDAAFIPYPTMISIGMQAENFEMRCGLHIGNYNRDSSPKIQKIGVLTGEEIQAMLTCIIGSDDGSSERFRSESGTFDITEINRNQITGTLDMVIIGAVSEREFRLTGEVDAISKELRDFPK